MKVSHNNVVMFLEADGFKSSDVGMRYDNSDIAYYRRTKKIVFVTIKLLRLELKVILLSYQILQDIRMRSS